MSERFVATSDFYLLCLIVFSLTAGPWFFSLGWVRSRQEQSWDSTSLGFVFFSLLALLPCGVFAKDLRSEFVAFRIEGDDLILERVTPLSNVELSVKEVKEVHSVYRDFETERSSRQGTSYKFHLHDGRVFTQQDDWPTGTERNARRSLEKWLGDDLQEYEQYEPRAEPTPVRP